MLILEITLGVFAAYAVDAWQLKRWLKRERPEDWLNYKKSVGWRHVAISWIVLLVVAGLAAFVIGR